MLRKHGMLPGVLAMAAWIGLAGCGSETKEKAGPVSLKGAGATAPNLAYTKWVDEFRKAQPGISLEYKATGSGDGIRQLEAGTVDFAASDIPLTNEQIAQMKVKPLHFPTLVGAIVPVYNLPNAGTLQFTGEVLAGIFSGKVKTWNDASIAKINPKATLPAAPIVVVHRSDASGSTYAFTDFLSKVSPAWKSAIGQGAMVKWPASQGAEGNEGVATTVQKTPHSIGYVELNYAITSKLQYGAVQNAAGKFQKAEIEALGAAVDIAADMKKDFRISLVNAPAERAYPISTLSWLIVPSSFSDPAKTKAMKQFLRWCYDDGQKLLNSFEYDGIPQPLLAYVKDQIGDIQ